MKEDEADETRHGRCSLQNHITSLKSKKDEVRILFCSVQSFPNTKEHCRAEFSQVCPLVLLIENSVKMKTSREHWWNDIVRLYIKIQFKPHRQHKLPPLQRKTVVCRTGK
jgi:hypothetical protein